MINTEKLDFDKVGGLMPAIIQDATNGLVLMLGYMNPEALANTIRDNEVWFYSRTRKRLWKKGESSGNILKVKTIITDCDNDSLLIKAEPLGPTCHQGTVSCFKDQNNVADYQIPNVLEKIIESRFSEQSTDSYTVKLLNEKIEKVAQKVGEEAVETVIAAMKSNKDETVYETADLFYHVTLLLFKMKLKWADVFQELRSRMH
jgi:phosphoribosyl-ATP pyrophosphohydrolase/phosphoribosyl-AMP cyclohydrolase